MTTPAATHWTVPVGPDETVDIPRGSVDAKTAVEILDNFGWNMNIYFRSADKTGLLRPELWDVIGKEPCGANTIRHKGVPMIGLRDQSVGGPDCLIKIVGKLEPVAETFEFTKSFSSYGHCENDFSLIVALVDVGPEPVP